MFNNSPITNNTRAAGATSTSTTSVASGLRFQIISLADLWDPDTMPAADFEKYVVPKEGWLVWDRQDEVLIWYYVYKVYQNKSELRVATTYSNEGGTTEDQDVIFGEKGGPLNGEGIMGVDYAVRPNRASIDSTVVRPGAAYAYLFLGDNIDPDNGGEIISAVYDKSNNLVTNKIPVGLAAINNYTNNEIKWCKEFSVTKNADALPNGSRCTLVFFDQGDMVITPTQRIVVQQCSYLRNREKGIRYVMDIELVSAWFTDSGDPDKLIIPITTPLAGIEFRAIVHYSNGDKEELTVNGNKFQLLGVNEYRPSYPGQTAELALIYTLADDEQFYVAQPGVDGRWTRVYQIMAGNVEGAYAPKIYTWPVWQSQGSQWALRHWMYDLDRKTFVEVTDKVTLNESSPPFKPSSYNTVQDLTFNLILKDVSPTYNSTIFKQDTNIILYKDLNGPGKRWGVGYAQDKPVYDSLFAKVTNNADQTLVNISNGFSSQEDWLNALYWSVLPSYDMWNEEKAPTPDNYYIMLADGTRYVNTLVNWENSITVPVELQKGTTIFICWVKKDDTGNEKQLAMTGVVVDTGS